MRKRIICSAALVAAGLTACGIPSAPPIVDPVAVKSYCGDRKAVITSIKSVLTSTDDKLVARGLAEAKIVREITSTGGVIARWNDQPLKVPDVAAELGASDDYAPVAAVAIPKPVSETIQSRAIYVLTKDHGKPSWIELDAFDVQDVCIEAKLQS